MKTITYTEARNNLNKIISSVAEDKVPYIIAGTKGRKDAVLLAKDDFDNLIEHLHILSDKDWFDSVKKGIKELDSSKGIKSDINSVLGLGKK